MLRLVTLRWIARGPTDCWDGEYWGREAAARLGGTLEANAGIRMDRFTLDRLKNVVDDAYVAI